MRKGMSPIIVTRRTSIKIVRGDKIINVCIREHSHRHHTRGAACRSKVCRKIKKQRRCTCSFVTSFSDIDAQASAANWLKSNPIVNYELFLYFKIKRYWRKILKKKAPDKFQHVCSLSLSCTSRTLSLSLAPAERCLSLSLARAERLGLAESNKLTKGANCLPHYKISSNVASRCKAGPLLERLCKLELSFCSSNSPRRSMGKWRCSFMYSPSFFIVQTEWLTLLRILEVPGSISAPATCYPD
jgi:hypothetical protein